MRIDMPEYWDRPKVLQALRTLSGQELYKYFNCRTAQAFSSKLKHVFPNKPPSMSYARYILDNEEECVISTKKLGIIDPQPQKSTKDIDLCKCVEPIHLQDPIMLNDTRNVPANRSSIRKRKVCPYIR